jgi:hypothetical protein
MRINVLLYILVFSTFTGISQTNIPGGFVSGNWVSSQSPYYIQGNIEIHFDSVLNIEPGVDVLFDGSYKLTVRGQLNAMGNETDSILFTAINTTTGWQGIEFYQINGGVGISKLHYCILTHGYKANGMGGAIYVYKSHNISINHCLIKNNYASEGGGIYIDDGWINITNCIVANNVAKTIAGGIACVFSVPYFYNLQVSNNTSGDAGGIYFGYNPSYSYPFFSDLTISNNQGGEAGGLWLDCSISLVLDNCRINNNRGDVCGGILLNYSSLGVWGYPAQKSRVYMNKGGWAQELFYNGDESAMVHIDTFTVINPDSYLVYPLDKINFIAGIQYGLIEQADTNLYISESGSDTNNGLSPETPLRSFDYALRKIISTAEEKNTIWVLPGHYSLSISDSATPVYLKNHVKIAATVPGESIIDGDSINRVFYGYGKNNFSLSGLKIQNGRIEQLPGANFASDLSGGGLCIISSNGTVDNCTFFSNSSNYFGGGVFLYQNYNMNFTNCKFIHNTSGTSGGGLSTYYPATSAQINLNNCEFISNHSGSGGGGVSLFRDQTNIINCRFSYNTSVNSGAGALFNEKAPNLVNCLFNNNISDGNGGGCFINGGNNSKIVNCTFSDNMSNAGSAIYLVYTSNVKMFNSIFWNTTVPYTDMIHLKAGASCFINSSDIQGGEEAIVLEGTGSQYYWQEGNITNYPAYIDPANQDYTLNWNSPCIEAGKDDTTGLNLPLTDLNGDPRFVNARVDMGAYEFQFPVSVTPRHAPDFQFRIYPLAASTHLNIEFPAELNYDHLFLSLFSSMGQEVKSIYKPDGCSKVEMDISEISTGLYFLVIKDSRSVINTCKILVAR